MCRRVSIPIVATLLLNACNPIVVRVGKRSSGAEEEPAIPYRGEVDVSKVASWNSVEDFLQHLDEIKQLGRDALLKRYHENGRQQIRQVFRQFRDSVEEQASRDSSQQKPYLGGIQLGTCVPISVRDVFDLGPYGDLRAILETVFLSRLKPSEAVPDPALPGDMDEIAKLGFFELGIAMDGQSFYEAKAETEIQGSDLRWKVIHEQNEPEEWVRRDERSVQFRFLRTHELPDRNHFIMEARVGPQVYEQGDTGTLPSLLMDYHRNNEAQGQSYQAMLLQTGWRDAAGHWQKLQVSRKIIVNQDIHQGHILHVSVTEHFQKREAVQENFRLDMDARSLCSELGGS